MTTAFSATTPRNYSPKPLVQEILPLPPRKVAHPEISRVSLAELVGEPVGKRHNPGARGLHDSNTWGYGRAVVPRSSHIRRRQRIAHKSASMFDNSYAHTESSSMRFFDRWEHAASRCAESKAGMALAVATIVLSLGLSPLVAL